MKLVFGTLDEDAAVGERNSQAADVDVSEDLLVSDILEKNDVFVSHFG